jgi:hypothetical protein
MYGMFVIISMGPASVTPMTSMPQYSGCWRYVRGTSRTVIGWAFSPLTTSTGRGG